MRDRLRAHVADFLAAYGVALLSVAGPEGVWAMPVCYQLPPGRDLAVVCLLPTWADAVYFLEQDPRVLLVINDTPRPLCAQGGPRGPCDGSRSRAGRIWSPRRIGRCGRSWRRPSRRRMRSTAWCG